MFISALFLRSWYWFLKVDPMVMKGMLVTRLACIVGFLIGAVFTLPAPAAECVPVTRTGQTDCYDSAGTQIGCTHTGQDGELRTGMAWPQPRFTDGGNGTVRDNLTALVWTKDAQHIKGTMAWADALATCNDLDFAGHNDWRLPNARELLSLIDYEAHDPALPQGHPFDNVQYLFYWSSTTYDASAVNAWGVYLCNGYAFNYHKATKAYVWPVRSADNDDKRAPSVITGRQAE
jgi:hypothetical protein